MNKKNSIDNGLGILPVENAISPTTEISNSPTVFSRRKMMSLLAVAGLFSVLDEGCLLDEGIKEIPIGFEPFEEGEKKEWTGPDKPVDRNQMISFLRKVLPGMVGKAGPELMDVCNFGLLKDKITLECSRIPTKDNGDPAMEVYLRDGVASIHTKGWNIYITHNTGSIRVSAEYNHDDINSKCEYFCDGDDNFAYFDSEGVNYVELVDEDDDISRFFIKDYESILRFLNGCKNPEILEALLKKINEYHKPLDFSGISENIQLREILRLVPEKFGNEVLLSGFRYARNDRDGGVDAYRNPIETLQSGWGDCDDYCVLNAIWIYAHGYTPLTVDLDDKPPGGCASLIPRAINGHVFEFFINSKNKTVVCDNQQWSVLDGSMTIYDYIANIWPDMNIFAIRKPLADDGVLEFQL